jgi:hypothetical protein
MSEEVENRKDLVPATLAGAEMHSIFQLAEVLCANVCSMIEKLSGFFLTIRS